MNANIMNTPIFIYLSMTSTVIEGHKKSLHFYFNLNLRSYGQLFSLFVMYV